MSSVPISNIGVFAPATEPNVMLANSLPDLNNKVVDLTDEIEKIEEEPEDDAAKSLARLGLLPEESRELYLKRFEDYKAILKKEKWDIKKEDSALLWAETHREEATAPSTMYSVWSSIKACLTALLNIPANLWCNVKKWLKNYAAGVFPKQAPLFTAAQVEKFMKEAPDKEFIRHKLALGLGLYGRLRAQEYTWLFHSKSDREKIDLLTSYLSLCLYLIDWLYPETFLLTVFTLTLFLFVLTVFICLPIDKNDKMLRVKYYKKKNKSYHDFCVGDEYTIGAYERYLKKTKHFFDQRCSQYGSRVFWQYRKRKNIQDWYHHGQPQNIRFFNSYPKAIAQWLGLENWFQYTGHSVCRTGTTLFANSGASVMQLKKYGCWKSTTAAERYYGDSIINKRHASKKITEAIFGRRPSIHSSSQINISQKDDNLSISLSHSVDRNHNNRYDEVPALDYYNNISSNSNINHRNNRNSNHRYNL